jgi:hypothetical protein
VITAARASFLWRGFTFWHLSGFLEQIWQFKRGNTIDLGIWQFELGYLLHSRVAIVPGSYCILFTVKDISSTSYIHHISKLVFPGGVYPGSYDEKYLCLHMHFSGCLLALRSVHISAEKIV